MRLLTLSLVLFMGCGDDDGTVEPDASFDGGFDAGFDGGFDGGCPDRDGDGACDTDDACPDDAAKIAPGTCGCGIADEDSDDDGTLDCEDECPADPAKVLEGVCGCSMPDVDTDSDGELDCNDGCPMDMNKVDPGMCGCGELEDDTDGDGTADCVDLCPADPLKADPGVCGCGNSEVDADDNGTPDCVEGCADGEREGFREGAHPQIAGCGGGWSVPGVRTFAAPACARAAGDDSADASGTGCNIEDLCQEGWHVCTGPSDVASNSATGCVGLVSVGDPGAFYVTRASGSGGGMCEATGNNDIFGCGTLGAVPNAATCAPLDRFSQDQCGNIPTPPWNCAGMPFNEANIATHDGTGPGGVLCCVDS